jgi:hypothetical protein
VFNKRELSILVVTIMRVVFYIIFVHKKNYKKQPNWDIKLSIKTAATLFMPETIETEKFILENCKATQTYIFCNEKSVKFSSEKRFLCLLQNTFCRFEKINERKRDIDEIIDIRKNQRKPKELKRKINRKNEKIK